MRRSVLVRNTPVVGVSAFAPQFAACGRAKALKILALFSCLAATVTLSSCIQHSSSGGSNPLVVLANNGSQQSAVVGTAFSAPLVAQVSRGGTAAKGVAVTFTAPSSGASGTFANGQLTETDTSDSNGLATSSTLTANTTTGQFQVTATASGAALNASFGLANTSTTSVQLNISVTNGSQQSADVGAPFGTALQVRVANNGVGVQGVTVTFTAPNSGASGTFINGKITESDVTDSNGLATASTFTANSIGGQYQVTASAPNATAVNLYLTNTSAAQLSLSVNNGSLQSANTGTAFATAMQVRVANNGTGVQGVTVTFTAPSSGASGTFVNGTATENDVTDSNGLATASTFTANSVVGQYQVTASISGGASGLLYLTNTAGAGVPSVVQAEGGTPQTTTVSSAFA
jgi:hypothetical protein